MGGKRKREEWEGCNVDWESDEDDWDDTACIGGAAEMTRYEGKVHARMKKRMARYVKGDSTKGKMSTFDYREED